MRIRTIATIAFALVLAACQSETASTGSEIPTSNDNAHERPDCPNMRDGATNCR